MEKFFNEIISTFSSSLPSFIFEWSSLMPQLQSQIRNQVFIKLEEGFIEKKNGIDKINNNDNTTIIQKEPMTYLDFSPIMKTLFERVIDQIDDMETLAECALVCRTFRDIVVGVRKQVIPMCQWEYYILNCQRLHLKFPSLIKIEVFHTFTEDNSVWETCPNSLKILDLSDYYNEENNNTFLPCNLSTSLQSLILPWMEPTPYLKERILGLLTFCSNLMIYFQLNCINYNLIYWATSRCEIEILTKALQTIRGRAFVDIAYGETPLGNAAQNGFSDLAKLLLENGALVNLPCSADLKTPLIRAVINNYPDLVELFTQYGADWHFQDISKKSAFDYANLLGHYECVKLYLGASGKEVSSVT